MLTALVASAFVMLISLSGKLLTWRGVGPFIERNLHFFVSFAAGVMLVITLNIFAEIREHAGSFAAGLPWVGIGALAILVAFRFLPHFHHHHEQDGHTHSRIDANRVLTSDAIHNVGDGIVIAASFAASPLLGISSTASIAVHEMLQEISEFFVLRSAGLSTRQALIRNFVASATILIGTVGAYLLLDRFAATEVPLLGLSAGSYLVVVFHDLIPHSFASAPDRWHLMRHFIFFVLGGLLMGSLIALLPHSA